MLYTGLNCSCLGYTRNSLLAPLKLHVCPDYQADVQSKAYSKASKLVNTRLLTNSVLRYAQGRAETQGETYYSKKTQKSAEF